MKALVPVLAAATLLGLAGCNPTDAKDVSNDAGNLAKSATRAAGNAHLVARVGSVLVQKKRVDMSGLHIEAENGTVTVGGHVKDEKMRKLVLETVDSVRGVEKVVDKLRIK